MRTRVLRDLLFVLLVALFATIAAPASSFADAETAARQAEIDAAQAQVNVDNLQAQAEESESIDGVDSPEGEAAQAQIGAQEDAEQNAEAREMQAERQMGN